MERTVTTAVLGLMVLLTGCTDLGLEGNVLPEESSTRPPPELVAAVMAPAEEEALRLIVDGRLWVTAGQPFSSGAMDLRPIGSASGHTVYARSWDQPPFRAVFVQLPAPVALDALTPGEAMAAQRTRWQAFAPVVGR